MVSGQLIEQSWLRRTVEVSFNDEKYIVKYDGHGTGYESVYVNDELVAREISICWYVPHFRFPVGNLHGELHVQVWPWLALRKLMLFINGVPVYAEESQPANPRRLTLVGGALAFVGAALGSIGGYIFSLLPILFGIRDLPGSLVDLEWVSPIERAMRGEFAMIAAFLVGLLALIVGSTMIVVAKGRNFAWILLCLASFPGVIWLCFLKPATTGDRRADTDTI